MNEPKRGRVLILQCASMTRPENLTKLRDNILEQLETGVVVLPYWLNFVACTEDMITDVKILEAEKNE